MIDDFDLMLSDLNRIKGKLVDQEDLECMEYVIWLIKNVQKMDAMLEMGRCGGKYDA